MSEEFAKAIAPDWFHPLRRRLVLAAELLAVAGRSSGTVVRFDTDHYPDMDQAIASVKDDVRTLVANYAMLYHELSLRIGSETLNARDMSAARRRTVADVQTGAADAGRSEVRDDPTKPDGAVRSARADRPRKRRPRSGGNSPAAGADQSELEREPAVGQVAGGQGSERQIERA